ncbi:hypothetical protein Krac_8605 [Ktedonobacter racemifer DSM 44963]|uniref:Adhesin domain-containing protein n=1 Tax=Ktedonobacter racemifer DSM 44963 TaxID=485913 RepID=D6TNE4_KTERA|nr:hypothetical protein Krac_8605 [Ktedonobacter racemifer DSM 44963]
MMKPFGAVFAIMIWHLQKCSSHDERQMRLVSKQQESEQAQAQSEPESAEAPTVLAPGRKRRRAWLVVVVLVCCVLLGGMLIGIGATGSFTRTASLEERSYAAQPGQPASLDIRLDAGSIHIQRSNDASIHLSGTRHYGFLGRVEDVQVQVSQVGNMLYVKQTAQEGLLHLGWTGLDLNVSAPSTTNLRLSVGSGIVAISGMSSQVNVFASVGAVTLDDSNLENGSSIYSNTGTVLVRDVTLHGHVSLSSSVGTVAFSGKLDANGLYAFHSNNGAVSVALPSDASFIVDKLSTTSTIISNEFRTTHVGHGPYAHIVLMSQNGPLLLRKMGV